jgi:hypothetical protein
LLSDTTFVYLFCSGIENNQIRRLSSLHIDNFVESTQLHL